MPIIRHNQLGLSGGILFTTIGICLRTVRIFDLYKSTSLTPPPPDVGQCLPNVQVYALCYYRRYAYAMPYALAVGKVGSCLAKAIGGGGGGRELLR